VLDIYKHVSQIKFSREAVEFMLYFMRMNQCVKSPDKSKLTLNIKLSEHCKGCHLIGLDGGICGNVYAPSERTIDNWRSLAQAFTLFRVSRVVENQK